MNENLTEALKAIASAASIKDRDRLMIKYGAPDGGRDRYDQIAFVANAVLKEIAK